jgi:hypothetical protein
MAHINFSLLLMMLIHTVKKNTDAVVVVSKEIVLEENVDKTKYMVMSGVQNAGHVTT